VVTDNALYCLRKLKLLRELEINNKCHGSYMITDNGVCCLIGSCEQLRTLMIRPQPQITIKTIDTLIENALKRPRIVYYYDFYFTEHNSTIPIHSQKYVPKNLFIKNIKLS